VLKLIERVQIDDSAAADFDNDARVFVRVVLRRFEDFGVVRECERGAARWFD